MKYFLIILVLMFSFAFCSTSISDEPPLKIKETYSKAKSQILNKRKNLFLKYQSSTTIKKKNQIIDSSSQLYTRYLINNIFPHWYGTGWDFNGTTPVPNQGDIACGYFVSTTMEHIGFKLNRYKMAQQSSLNEAKSIDSKIEYYRYLNRTQMKDSFLKHHKNGLYLVGLDFHVGYLYVNNNDLYFIHSSYIIDKVVSEKAELSDAFNSKLYVVADITHNRPLAKKWILNQRIIIKKD